MRTKNEIMYDFFSIAEKYYYHGITEYNNLKYNKNIEFIDKNELLLKENYIASQFGLSLEYYLKGIIFPFLEIGFPDGTSVETINLLSDIVTNLTGEEERKLIIGDDSIVDELSQRYQVSKSKIRILQNRSSLKYFSHDTKKLFEFILEDNRVPQGLKVILKNYVITEFDKFGLLPNKEERKMVYQIDRNTGRIGYIGLELDMAMRGRNVDEYNDLKRRFDELDQESIEKLITLLDEEGIKSAFPKGRYGFLDEYQPDNKKLKALLCSIRAGIKKYFNGINLININYSEAINGITTTSNYFDLNDSNYSQWATSKLVFPDIGSKIYVLNNSDELNRVYTYNTPSNIYANMNGINPEDVKNQDLQHFAYDLNIGRKFIESKTRPILFLEYVNLKNNSKLKRIVGIDKYNENTDIIFETMPKQTDYDRKNIESIVITRDGKQISYSFINGEFIKNQSERTQELGQVCQKYELKQAQLDSTTGFNALERQLKREYFYGIITGRYSAIKRVERFWKKFNEKHPELDLLSNAKKGIEERDIEK